MPSVKGDIFAVTIEGEYYAHRNGAKTTGRYEVTLRMDETAKSIGFLSVARNKLLPRALKAKYPDYKRFKTHTITNAVNESQNNKPVYEIGLMNRKQLVSYITQKRFAKGNRGNTKMIGKNCKDKRQVSLPFV